MELVQEPVLLPWAGRRLAPYQIIQKIGEGGMASHADQDATQQRDLWLQARSWYVKSLDTWPRIQSPSRDGPNGFDADDPAQVAKSLHLCETALAKAGAGPGA
jgi:hypothetical protein